ncbi:MAG: dihydrodipicolinate synthase family protein [Paracoccus sp. (in: a-proteobacteria)]
MLNLPNADGTLEPFCITRTPLVPRSPVVPFTRVAFAAAHVVSDPLAERDPWMGRPSVDWEATLSFRNSLWDQGLGLAEAMDTAQRGMGVDWETARELIARTMAAAKVHPLRPRVACGAGTDHKTLAEMPDVNAIIAAYEHQMAAIESEGGQLILMATRALPAIGARPDDYMHVYDRLISQARDPVILHWLGDMFDPELKGYWGSVDIGTASDVVLTLIETHRDKVDGIKISLLDQVHEEFFRAHLPEDIKLYTGDDFNYASLIAGDGVHHSHALLGIFAAIAPAAAQALEALANGDRATYDGLLEPTVPLSREIFRTPTRFYKAGVAFLAWLNGAQSHFIMPAGFQSSRSITHYAEIFRLAAAAGLLMNPDLAVARMRKLLAIYGIEG